MTTVTDFPLRGFTRGVTLDLARGAANAIDIRQTQRVCML
jgi:hypothetical protein